MILAWSLVLFVAGPAEPAPATAELRPAPAPRQAREADATTARPEDERVAFVPNSDLRDPFADRRGSGRQLAAAGGPARRSTGLKDPFAPEALRPPAKRRPPEVRPTVPEGVLVDPFAARRGAQHPPPRLSAELKDPFRAADPQVRAADAQAADAERRSEAAAPTRAPSQPEACAASERDGVAIQRPEALRRKAPPCRSATPRSP